MKFSALLFAVPAAAFSPAFTTTTTTTTTSLTTPSAQRNQQSTRLFISSWGTKGSPFTGADTIENMDPSQNIQAYLKSPEPVEARSNIDGTVLVSGLVKSKERTDQYIFDLLNDEESAFEFEKIVAFVDDVSFAKKRLLSRSARYTGLLDKLDFSEASSPGNMPTAEQLEGVKSWIVYIDEGDMLAGVKEAAAIAKEASTVENIAVLLVDAAGLDTGASSEAVQSLKDSGKKYSLVAVGELEEHEEGRVPFKYMEFGTEEAVLEEKSIFSREESLRLVTECLQLECGVDKAWSFAEVKDKESIEAKLVKGLREAGYARPQEIDHILRDGPSNYQKAMDEFKEKNPNGGVGTTDAWWEDEEFQKSVSKKSLRLKEGE